MLNSVLSVCASRYRHSATERATVSIKYSDPASLGQYEILTQPSVALRVLHASMPEELTQRLERAALSVPGRVRVPAPVRAEGLHSAPALHGPVEVRALLRFERYELPDVFADLRS